MIEDEPMERAPDGALEFGVEAPPVVPTDVGAAIALEAERRAGP